MRGWSIEGEPSQKTEIYWCNGQKILFKTSQQDLRLRLFVYKVTVSSRNRPAERRIEITSTYGTGLARLGSYPDTVLGYEADQKIFVGVDAER